MVPPSSGVYQIRWAINGKPKVIRRANGDDYSGLLYIGETKNLRARIKGFWLYVIRGRGRHTAGWTYWYYNFNKKFPPKQLEVRWATCSEFERLFWEDELLQDYGGKYLDKPPLNIKFPRH
jgi:hypothetical protein